MHAVTATAGSVNLDDRWLESGQAASCHAMLCCAVLCCAVLCCAVLCCAVLCCAVLCCAVLCCNALHCPVLCRAVQSCTLNMLSSSIRLSHQLPFLNVLASSEPPHAWQAWIRTNSAPNIPQNNTEHRHTGIMYICNMTCQHVHLRRVHCTYVYVHM